MCGALGGIGPHVSDFIKALFQLWQFIAREEFAQRLWGNVWGWHLTVPHCFLLHGQFDRLIFGWNIILLLFRVFQVHILLLTVRLPIHIHIFSSVLSSLLFPFIAFR